MTNPLPKIQLKGGQKVETFMTAQAYREFAEKFQAQVKADLDKQREARIRSEESAKKHLVW